MKEVIIQKDLLEELKEALKDHNKVNKPKLNQDVAVYFLSLLNSIPSFYRDDDQREYVNLNSQILKKTRNNYSDYLKMFLKNKFIEKGKSHSADINKSTEYQIVDKYNVNQIERYEIKDKILLKKFNEGLTEKQVEKKEYCERLRPHLIKSFNDNLSMDTSSAYKEVYHLTSEKSSYRKYLTNSSMINEWNKKEWKYSIKTYSDNRIHSTITRTPKVLRKHIRYNNEHIVGWDISSSQPYFFVVVIKAIFCKREDILKQVGAYDILGEAVVEKLFSLNINREEVIDFVLSILQGDFYESFQEIIKIKYNLEGQPYRNVFVRKGRDTRLDKVYESERDLVKKVVMEIFYSSNKTTIPEAKVFRNAYPSIYKIMSCIKESDVKFSYLLQFIEAYCLLDYTALKTHEKHPEMPLFSIHDSLVTTESYKDILEEEMITLLEEVTTIKPQLKLEDWKQNFVQV